MECFHYGDQPDSRGYMELIGSLAGFWHYHFMEPLAIFIVLAWPINTCAVHGFIYLVGIDLGHIRRDIFCPKGQG